MHLPQEEVSELETEVGRDIRVGVLLVGKCDVETGRFGPGIESPAVGRFHDPRATPGHHHEPAFPRYLADLADQSRELSRNLVVIRLGRHPYRHRQPPLKFPVPGVSSQDLRRFPATGLGDGRLEDPGAAEHHDGRFDPLLLEGEFRLQVFQLQADGSELVTFQEIDVRVGTHVGRTFHEPPDPVSRFRIAQRHRETAVGKGFLSLETRNGFAQAGLGIVPGWFFAHIEYPFPRKSFSFR